MRYLGLQRMLKVSRGGEVAEGVIWGPGPRVHFEVRPSHLPRWAMVPPSRRVSLGSSVPFMCSKVKRGQSWGRSQPGRAEKQLVQGKFKFRMVW